MSDYNDGLLPDPCLRMDTHFGDEYESVEFGDGTGYVKAEPTLARLGALYVELDALQAENAKLRELVRDLAICACGKYCYGCPHQYDGCDRDERIRELGVEVDG